jgi:hypothetical protein
MERLREFDWKKTRQVVLTINPKKFHSGEEAHHYATEHRCIAGLIRNLKRGKKEQDPDTLKWVWKYKPIKIKNWMWFLEWHADGRPHWHVFVEVEKAGKSGMIGGDRLRDYWPHGALYEAYAKSELHWQRLTGYFGQHGYFEVKGKHEKNVGKGHQSTLPAWAAEKEPRMTVRRSGAMARKRVARAEIIVLSEYFERKGREYQRQFEAINDGDIVDTRTGEIIGRVPVKRSYKALISDCGNRTRVKLISAKGLLDMTLDIPYRKIRGLDGEYRPGKGYAFAVSAERLTEWLDKIYRVNLYRGVEEFCDRRILEWQAHRRRVDEEWAAYEKEWRENHAR